MRFTITVYTDDYTHWMDNVVQAAAESIVWDMTSRLVRHPAEKPGEVYVEVAEDGQIPIITAAYHQDDLITKAQLCSLSTVPS